ncbi:uncharacterized protein LOC109706531 isoform X1 [Ananas comosus]|uniref:Uncharacterized protein LOC109706531 isoform X1 n=1 Tax=Ananas comosus TaxID=4615 RepID=A0A6P5EHS8_ANACO|nr:uncharacterized protein LOC109706531 isoform X1 [Ananas comosus]
MEETVLSWDSTPRSFGMDRRSPVADKLRAAVADELFHFLGDYSDDVLAEYIVVLVCNGKNQNQARDDLEAFLGDDSAKFVAWLWNYLNKETKVSDPPFDSSNHQTGVTSGRSDILSKDGLHEPAENPNLTCANTNEVNAGGSLNQTFETHNGVQRYTTSSSKIYSPEILNRCDRRLRYESQHHKIAQNNSIVVASGRSPLVNSELVARSTQSVHKEDFQLRHLNAVNATARRLPLKAMDVEEAEVPQPTTKRRGNVWDRLGKRSVEDDLLSRENTYLYGDNEEKHKKPWLASVEPYGKLNEDVSRKFSMVNKSCSEIISDNHVEDVELQQHNVNDIHPHDHVDNLKRKRHFNSTFSHFKGSHFPGREAVQKPDRNLPFKPEAKGYPGVKSSSVVQNVLQVSSRASAKPEFLITSENGNSNNNSMQDEMLDVKSKLRQVQINMLKLRSKQAEMSNAIIKAQPGPQNNQEEDTESRTVLVTNVHFAASKEALMSHFMKCGAIIKVIMLTDTITGQPKGAAYIVFKSKDSVDKAVSMNGTSFFSRILMVMHKADTPPGFLVPAQQATKPLQPWSSQPFQKPPYQKHSATSHLQWRRES